MLDLRSKARQHLLAYYFTNPTARLHLRDVAQRLNIDPSNLSKEFTRLEREGLFRSEVSGRQKYFQLNREYPLFDEVRKIVTKTIGAAPLISRSLHEIDGIDEAYLYGSFARNQQDAASDMDVLVIGRPSEQDLAQAVSKLERQLGREINYTVLTPKEFTSRRARKDAFLENVWHNERVALVGPNIGPTRKDNTMPNPPLPDFVTSLDWAGWTSVPTTPTLGYQPGFLNTDVAPAAAGNVILTPNVGYKYQCAVAIVSRQGIVWVNFASLVLPDAPTAPPLTKSLKWLEWTEPFPPMLFRAKLAPSLVAIGPELFLYAVFHADLGGNPNDSVSYTSTRNGNSWSPWKPVSGGFKPTNRTPCATPDGKLYVVSSEDGGVWVNPSPTTPEGSWLPVLPPFLTNAGVCACTGNSQLSPASALLCKPSGQESIEYLSPNAQAWSKLVPSEGSSGKTDVALASARITYQADQTPGGSILFRTALNRSIHWSDLFFPDAGSDSWYKPTTKINWNQLDGFETDQPVAAAVFDSTNYLGGIAPQFLALFAKDVSVGDVKMNLAEVIVGRAP